jgi:transposase
LDHVGQFWLSEAQWAAIVRHPPMVHTGPVRQDDRRIISGILHRLREGCRWRALPAEYGPYTTVFNRYNRWSKLGLWQDIFAALASCAEPPVVTIDRQHGGAGASRRERRKRGERDQAIGRSRGGRTRKIHALIDGAGRPLAFRLSGGNVADIVLAAPLLQDTAPGAWLIGDEGYNADHLRALLDSRGTIAVIPNKSNRKRTFPFDPERYKARNLIERTNRRLKDFRAIATRYDKLARNFLADLCILTALLYWCD